MIKESISQIVTLFHRPQDIAHHCSRPETRQATHNGAASEVRPQPRVVTEDRPCVLYRANSRFGPIDELAQSGADDIGFLAELAELVSAQ